MSGEAWRCQVQCTANEHRTNGCQVQRTANVHRTGGCQVQRTANEHRTGGCQVQRTPDVHRTSGMLTCLALYDMLVGKREQAKTGSYFMG